MSSLCGKFLRFVQCRLIVFTDLSYLEYKLAILISNSRKMIFLQIQLSWVCFDVLYVLNLFHDLFFLFRWCLLILILALVVIMHWCWLFRSHVLHCVPLYSVTSMFTHNMLFSCHRIILMHTSHSCIIATETPENENAEPAVSVEPKLSVEFVLSRKNIKASS